MLYSNSIVKTGNWIHNRCADEQKLLDYMTKRFNDNLLIQKTRVAQENFRKKVALTRKSGTIRFGSTIQLVSKNSNLFNVENMETRPVLAIFMTDERFVAYSQKITTECTLSVAMSKDARVRTSFMVVSPDDNPRDHEVIKYGQDFCLQCVEAEEEPLLVYCGQKSANLTTLAKERNHTYNKGELNIHPGLILKKDTGLNTMVPAKYTHWRFYKTDVGKRILTDAFETPVMTSEPLIVTHAALNRNLCCENNKIKHLFGMDNVVSVSSYNIKNPAERRHLWKIKVGKTMDSFH